MQHSDLTEKIIGCAFRVFNTLGSGFLESVYEKSLLIELHHAGLVSLSQFPLKVYYREEVVGQFVADVVVEKTVILELKACEELSKAHEVQLVNYLTATGYPVGLLINFSSKGVVVRRKIKDLSQLSR